MICAFSGTVVPGKKLGRTMGFPTANIERDGGGELPPNGVYFAIVYLEGVYRPYFSVLNQGRHPTFPEGAPTVEAHLLDFHGDLYGRRVRVEYLRFLRPERKFASMEELREQIARDKEAGRRYSQEKLTMQKFDGHVHLSDEGVSLVAEEMRAEGASRYAVLSCAQYDSDPVQNLATLLAKAMDPKNCFAYCSFVYPKRAQAGAPLDQLKLWMDAGFDGLKLLETKPDCAKATGARLDDPAYDPAFAWCEEHGVGVVWHVGDPATFWDPDQCTEEAKQNGWAYLDGTFFPLSELYSMTETVLNRHPNLKASLCHFYFVSDDPAHAARMLETYPNLRLDLTPGIEMFDGFTQRADFFRPFIEQYADRIFFGSDGEIGRYADYRGAAARTQSLVERFFRTQDEYFCWHWNLKGFGYSEETLNKLFCASAAAFHGEAPCPLNRDAALRACEYTIALLEEDGDPRVDLARSLTKQILDLL